MSFIMRRSSFKIGKPQRKSSISAHAV